MLQQTLREVSETIPCINVEIVGWLRKGRKAATAWHVRLMIEHFSFVDFDF